MSRSARSVVAFLALLALGACASGSDGDDGAAPGAGGSNTPRVGAAGTSGGSGAAAGPAADGFANAPEPPPPAGSLLGDGGLMGCNDLQVRFEAVIPTVLLLVDRSGSMWDSSYGSSPTRWEAIYDSLMDPGGCRPTPPCSMSASRAT